MTASTTIIMARSMTGIGDRMDFSITPTESGIRIVAMTPVIFGEISRRDITRFADSVDN